MNFRGGVWRGGARPGIARQHRLAGRKRLLFFYERHKQQMSRQSTRTFISQANADTSPESRCMEYLERKFNPDHKTESQHTLESAKKAVAFGLKTGLIRRTAQAHDYRNEIQETTRKIVALRHSVGWTQAFVDKQFGYKGKRTSRFEAGYQSYAATKRFLEHLERLVAHEMKHSKKRKQNQP